jgi:hypothetical protein
MEDDAGLKAVAVVWGLMWGMLLFPLAIGFAWIGRSAAVRSLRWPLVALFVLYLIAMLTLLTARI